MLIPFTDLQKRYDFTPKGVVHVGAHEGQELNEYHKIGIDRMIFIEALPEIYNRLVKNCSPYPDILCFNECVSDVDDQEVIFNVSSNDGQSSSFLQLGTHKDVHPEVRYVKSIPMKTIRLDTLLKGIDIDFDFLNMDLQGAEGHALKGMGDLLDQFNYLYLEVNKKELYKNCALVEEIDSYVENYGFKRVETLWCGNTFWGDAFFVRK